MKKWKLSNWVKMIKFRMVKKNMINKKIKK